MIVSGPNRANVHRCQRAGEGDAAIQRALTATRRYGAVPAAMNAAPPVATIDDDYDAVFASLAEVALGGASKFAEGESAESWCFPRKRGLLTIP